MKKLLTAAALCVSAVAFANVPTSQLSKNEDQRVFNTSQTHSLSGVARGKPGHEIALERRGLPDAKLDLRKGSIVTLDGKSVEAKAIPQGSEVKATFQLEGNAPIAVRVDAFSPSNAGTGGAGTTKSTTGTKSGKTTKSKKSTSSSSSSSTSNNNSSGTTK